MNVIKLLRGILEAITALIGFALLISSYGWKLSLSVFLLMWSTFLFIERTVNKCQP